MPETQNSDATTRRLRLGALLIAGILLVWYGVPWLASLWVPFEAEPRAVTSRGDLAGDEQTAIEIFRRASPSVVFITTADWGIDLWSRNVQQVPQGAGSGFIWDKHGHIVTNYHVIQNAAAAQVRLSNQRVYKSVLVGASSEHDLAVLRISVPFGGPEPVLIGVSSDLQVGQKVFAIGNPFGLDHTLTSGVISALDRAIPTEQGRTIEHVIQTDAAINPGNSGGPLIDSAGRVIGVNTAIFSLSGAYAGIGFAVPIDTVNRVVPQIIASGRYVRPSLGITIDDAVSEAVTEELEVQGVLVLSVNPGSPAAAAGLRGTRLLSDGGIIAGDIIQSIDGKPVRTSNELLSLLDDYTAGDTVQVAIYRSGNMMEIPVLLEAARS
ncbi:MAG: trypsin-like peptidase domain-containing protein [Gammaproteobacteria bacterium]|jgi:S1-C subfamily serine protease